VEMISKTKTTPLPASFWARAYNIPETEFNAQELSETLEECIQSGLSPRETIKKMHRLMNSLSRPPKEIGIRSLTVIQLEKAYGDEH
jgi:hypothetical protein